MPDFLNSLEKKVKQQLAGQRVGFLLGAGSSYLEGKGYPLATGLWDVIQERIPANERSNIQQKLDDGASGLEEALDLLDDGGVSDIPHRHSVTKAISEKLATLTPSLDIHSEFLTRLSRRNEPMIPIFSLNYDPLIERAADAKKVLLIDGFMGAELAYFSPDVFQKRSGPVAPRKSSGGDKKASSGIYRSIRRNLLSAFSYRRSYPYGGVPPIQKPLPDFESSPRIVTFDRSLDSWRACHKGFCKDSGYCSGAVTVRKYFLLIRGPAVCAYVDSQILSPEIVGVAKFLAFIRRGRPGVVQPPKVGESVVVKGKWDRQETAILS